MPRSAPSELPALAQHGDVAITVEILPAAQRQLEAADERWVDEHGWLAESAVPAGHCRSAGGEAWDVVKRRLAARVASR